MTRDRAPIAAAAVGVLIALVYQLSGFFHRDDVDRSRTLELLTAEPWYCEVNDPERQNLVSSSVETFHESGSLDGRTRLVDRDAGRVLLEFSYRGVWQFEDPWLTEAIEEYRYLHVDGDTFSPDELAAIEAEFAEPEVSRVHALTRGQLVYEAHQSLYQCHRRAVANLAAAATIPAAVASADN